MGGSRTTKWKCASELENLLGPELPNGKCESELENYENQTGGG